MTNKIASALGWKWILLFGVLTAGLIWVMVTSTNPETAVGLPATILRYVFPIGLLVSVALWLSRRFTITPQRPTGL